MAEARRYGSDPWVLVRELLQNARDADAASVSFATSTDGAVARLACRDDGRGLTFEEAQRDLFTLYASRKHGRDAGRFGVGFWSVLLFEPRRITVRSWPRKGEAWEVSWSGDLSNGRSGQPPHGPAGTEVVLETAGEIDVSGPVFAAAWRHARFLRTRDGRRPLAIQVDGRSANAPFELAAPSMAFRRRGLRGVVGLAATPRVELFAKGLLVRSGASLEDLLAPGARPGDASPASGLPGLSARFLLDSDDLDLLLSRGDARSDDALARVLSAAREELDRLLDRQLDRAGRRPWRATRVLRRAAALLAVTVGGAGLGGIALPRAATNLALATAPGVAVETRAAPPVVAADATGAAIPAAVPLRPYLDPRARYAGPVLDPLDHAPQPVALRYEPAAATVHLAALRIDGFDAAGSPRVAREPAGPYQGPPCTNGCVTIELRAAGRSWTSLPVPTGHRLDPDSVLVDGAPARASATGSDEALVRLDGDTVTVRYRTGPADTPGHAFAIPELPSELVPGVRAVAAVPAFARPAAASRWVRAHVRESRASDLADIYAKEAREGRDFALTALEVGAGDCDVQNGIVVRLLQATGVPARLAVGYVGVDGQAIPGLHAWVEHRAGGASWRVEDASGTAPREGPAAPAPPAPPAPWRLALFGPAVALVTAAGGLVALRLRPRRSFRLAPAADVAALVRGALRHPESVTRVPALLERALIPRLGGGRVTLAEAQRSADGTCLFTARHASALARRAAGEGGLVLDGARAEARAVADALGAVDLDLWSEWLDAAEGSDLLARVNSGLERFGERWRVRARRDGGSPRILDLPRSREVLLDAGTDWLEVALASVAARPAASALSVVERVAELLAIPEDRQAALLAPFAREALLEAAR